MMTAARRIDCPECRQSLRVPPEFAGTVAKCPNCRNRVKVRSQKNKGRPAPVSIAQHSAAHVRTQRQSQHLNNSLRDEAIFYKVLLWLLAATIFTAAGYSVGRNYTISQVEVARDSGLQNNFERNPAVKNFFDSLIDFPRTNRVKYDLYKSHE